MLLYKRRLFGNFVTGWAEKIILLNSESLVIKGKSSQPAFVPSHVQLFH